MGILDSIRRILHPRALRIDPAPSGRGALLRIHSSPAASFEANTVLFQHGFRWLSPLEASCIFGASARSWVKAGLPLAYACDDSGWSGIIDSAEQASKRGAPAFFMGRNLCDRARRTSSRPLEQSLAWHPLGALECLKGSGTLLARFNIDELRGADPGAAKDLQEAGLSMAWAIAKSPHPCLMLAMFESMPWSEQTLRRIINACHASGSTFILGIMGGSGPRHGLPLHEELFDACAWMRTEPERRDLSDGGVRAKAETLRRGDILRLGYDSLIRAAGGHDFWFDANATARMLGRRFAGSRSNLLDLSPCNPTSTEHERSQIDLSAGHARQEGTTSSKRL